MHDMIAFISKYFRLTLLGIASATLLNPADAISADDLFDPDTGYRIARYRSPTPADVPGGKAIDIDQYDELVKTGAVSIDVMIAEGAGPDPDTGSWRLSKERRSIPGSVWLANVGLGKLSPQIETYFSSSLEKLTGGNKAHPIIMFCLADCWMSWNAVQRAAALGYQNVYWFSDGTDGWRDWDRALAVITPEPVQVATFTARAEESKPSGLPLGTKTVTLISAGGERLDIATVEFSKSTEHNVRTFTVLLDQTKFQEEFLSMRPFSCLPDAKEMWCHLAYPYELERVITSDNLQDLEYGLLFLFKPPEAYGIDAWNGLYFKLALGSEGTLAGSVHEADFNILAVPPDEGQLRPITHDALSETSPTQHRFTRIEIR